jgi:prepilin-type N-terminal cleavage/methylation domain-containing protein
MKKYKQNKTAGFTLIELLVVIAIIGILSSVSLVSLATARKKGVDAATKTQLRQVQIALNIYYSNNNGYPNPSTNVAYCVGNAVCYMNGVLIPGVAELTFLDFSTDIFAQKKPSLISSLLLPVAHAAGDFPAFPAAKSPNGGLIYLCTAAKVGNATKCADTSSYVLYYQSATAQWKARETSSNTETSSTYNPGGSGS